jgi:glycosyltransferase involved in cell wall biosynthesis
MIFFDTTKTGRKGRPSGLNRVSARLRESLGADVQEVVWAEGLRDLARGNPVLLRASDAFLTTELFSEDERPGFTAFLASHPCKLAAIFHDAIPLKHPHITWPQSVARHPGYMKLLARFDRIWAVSKASRDELLGFWEWQGIERPPPVDVLPLGADFNDVPRIVNRTARADMPPQLLCLGIIEPRKNQSFLLDVCNELWGDGLPFELHVVGRVNPHFGRAIVAQIKAARRNRPRQVFFHEAASDAVVAKLYGDARAMIFPTIAEGCGLPLLESLWMGTPCVCSDLPVLRENADEGGCLVVKPNDRAAWKSAIQRVVTDHEFIAQLVSEAISRPLPTWQNAAHTLAIALR